MMPIVLALVFIGLLLIIVIAGQPNEMVVSRSATIAGTPEQVFLHVNDLHRWEAWSPWAKLDPDAKNTFSGAEAGAGAVMAWDGNKKVGAGQMTIVESQSVEKIGIRLEFFRPFRATNATAFQFQSTGRSTVVTWTMTGHSNAFFKVFGLFKNCDDIVGKDFEKGLASLKSVVEGSR